MQKKRLGKGLQALIPMGDNEKDVFEVSIYDIEPNKNQPRKTFEQEKMDELVESIKQHGIIQPLVVSKEGDLYKIIAGERRWRAARQAGLKKVPIVIRDVSESQSLEIALIENIQREDLNPIEEAEAYSSLMSQFGLSHEQVALKVGKSRPAITNSLRLLNLQADVRKLVEQGVVTGGHAKVLLAIEDKQKQLEVANLIIENKMSVRDTEKYIRALSPKKGKKQKKRTNAHSADIEQNLQSILGTKVRLMGSETKGKLLIEYYSKEELMRLLELFESLPN